MIFSAISKKNTLIITISVLNSRSLSPKHLVRVLSKKETLFLGAGITLETFISDLSFIVIYSLSGRAVLIISLFFSNTLVS